MIIKEYDAVVVSNKDPEGRNRVKLRVQGHHAGDMPESELPWCLVQPKMGSNSGKGQKETLTEGQFCKVQPLDQAETEFKVVGGSNAFRNPNNKKGKPYSVIENSELFDVPVPDLASLDPAKLARTVFVPLMSKLTKRISEPVIPFVGTCGMIDPASKKDKGGCGGGKPGCGGPGVPMCNGNDPLDIPPFQSRLRCRKKSTLNSGSGLYSGGEIDCKKFNCIVGTKPVTYNMKFDFERSVQTLSGKEIWVPCLESDLEIKPACKNQCSGNRCDPSTKGDIKTGVWEANGNSCSGIDVGCSKRPLVCDGLALCLPENTKCSKREKDPNDPNKTIMGLQTNKIKLIATSKIPGDVDAQGNPRKIVVDCEYYCGSNTCKAAGLCPGGPGNKFTSDDPFALDPTTLHFYQGSSKPIETIEIDFDPGIIGEQSDTINSRLVTIRNLHTQTLAGMAKVKGVPSTIFGGITVSVGKKMADASDKYIQEMFGNLVNQANRILGEVQAASTRSVNTAIDGAIKVVDNSDGALGSLDDNLGGVEKIPIKVLDQAVGGFGLGGVPGAFFHEVIRTDFLGKTENKFVTQYENGIAEVVDTSRGNKTWGVATNDGARIEIANNGTTLVKGANDVQIATESGTVSVTGANQITIVDGKATIHCDSFSVKAKTVDIAAPAIALNGDVEINGKLGVAETIEAKGKIFSKKDCIVQRTPANHISLYGHQHKGVSTGTSSTLPPTATNK